MNSAGVLCLWTGAPVPGEVLPWPRRDAVRNTDRAAFTGPPQARKHNHCARFTRRGGHSKQRQGLLSVSVVQHTFQIYIMLFLKRSTRWYCAFSLSCLLAVSRFDLEWHDWLEINCLQCVNTGFSPLIGRHSVARPTEQGILHSRCN